MTDFAARHIGPSEAAQRQMLDSLGYASLDELIRAALPEGTEAAQLSLPGPLSEPEALAELRRMASRNQVLTSMIGLGYYGTVTPAVIRRNVLENPAWYTAYTPYQPEISQGRLEALLNFQTMVADLTALPWAGASLLDEATAAAEAMTLARRAGQEGTRVPGGRRLPAADARRAAHQGRAARHPPRRRTGDGRVHRRPARPVRRAAAVPRRIRRRQRPGPADRGGARARARWPRWPPTCWP